MRAILVGPAGERDRLRRDLEVRSIEIVGEFDAMADMRRSGLETDIIVSTPGPRGSEVRLKPDTTLLKPDTTPPADRVFEPQPADRVFQEALTHRELEVLDLLAEGLPNKGIAERLGISDQTVKFHIASIMGKLGASNRVETVRRAVRRGLLSL
jgi:DNA-binding CsgD family transcriptional regulator